MRIPAAIALSLLISGSAIAQTTPSTTDAPAAAGQKPQSDPKQTSPGATGAMQNEAAGVATSPQEVRKQQEGTGPSGKNTTSPGTVGATPGDDPAQPKPK
ncbi:hypothetical protein IHQ68_00110 [Chelatococcus sambhunathii]|uniref:Serine/threonine protein kinase n=1 Tax=Chelatococcus sambhunathii TaxID=363953 RepID=A0ABU1DAF8_9HYPH|nr:hypothetical protein [Chelatococcus sambhunathii]MDR4305031.1 hypothetical protein [Chelatococcus sambhunathii]